MATGEKRTAGADLNVERLRLFAEEIAPELGWKPATSHPHQEARHA